MNKTKRMFIIFLTVIIVLGTLFCLLRPYFLNITFGISDYFRDRGLTTPDDMEIFKALLQMRR